MNASTILFLNGLILHFFTGLGEDADGSSRIGTILRAPLHAVYGRFTRIYLRLRVSGVK